MTRIRIYKSDSRRLKVNAFAFFAAAAALLTFVYAQFGPRDPEAIHVVIYSVWIIGPPIWFVLEYFFIFDNWDDPNAVEEFKYVEGLTSKVWVAIFVLLSVIYKLNGPLQI